ncbi:hypothetical protein V6237_10295 [Pseudoalteromonas carrageenovora]|uniref:hypothetical protein n=1 Tax=Pseudoalteromonas carrageenovora TaxID=227 RepID=UPI00311E932E
MEFENIFGNCVLFHPGIGKTGTSAIQSLGLQLPIDDPKKSCFSPFGVFGGAHNVFAANHPNFKVDKFKQARFELLHFCLNRDAATVVSSEFLIRLTIPQIKEMIEPFLEQGVKVKAVFSIRDYESYLASSYMQAVKVNWGKKEGENLGQFCQREIEHIRYTQLIDRWAQIIGDENIYLLDYDKYRKDFVSLFFNSLGINTEKDKLSAVRGINTSIPLIASGLMEEFDKVSDDINARQNLIELIKTMTFSSNDLNNKKIIKDIVKNKFIHDKERLTQRYNWVNSHV